MPLTDETLLEEIFLRWPDPDPRHVPLLREGGITAVLAEPDPRFEEACAAAGITSFSNQVISYQTMQAVRRGEVASAVALTEGVWPGIQRQDPATASATRSVWVDANGWRVGLMRALCPDRAPVLGYLPDEAAGVSPERMVPFESLELALVEAWMSGGNYILAVEPRYREELLREGARALAAWRRLGRTARWLRENTPLFRQQVLPTVTVLVDESDITAEIANLMYRQNVSPSVAAVADPPAPDARRLVLVAAGIEAPDSETRRRILTHATVGTTIVVDEAGERAWWRTGDLRHVQGQTDRDVFQLGRGRVVAFKDPIGDPGEFALDVIDILGQERRAARLWNSQAGLVVAMLAPEAGPRTGAASLHIVNYGSNTRDGVLARIHGVFRRATLLRPEAEAVPVEVTRRGEGSEVLLRELGRAATIVFS